MGSSSLQKIVSAVVAATLVYIGVGVVFAAFVPVDDKVALPVSLAAFRVFDDVILSFAQRRRLRGQVKELLDQLLSDTANNSPHPPPWTLLTERLHELLTHEASERRTDVRSGLQCVQSHTGHRTHQALRLSDLEPLQTLQRRLA